MVHGLQSTPVEFAGLVNALRADPVIRSRYQIWQFYYASGTPVLVNAAALRDSLVQTIHAVVLRTTMPVRSESSCLGTAWVA